MTRRERIIEALKAQSFSIRDLSYELGVNENTIAEDLDHIARSLKRAGEEKLMVEPAQCLGCGFRFKNRGRATKPSKCPKCRSTRIALAIFTIQ